MKRLVVFLILLSMVCIPASAENIHWVNFDVPYESLKYAMEIDIATYEQDKHIDWVESLALAAFASATE